MHALDFGLSTAILSLEQVMQMEFVLPTSIARDGKTHFPFLGNGEGNVIRKSSGIENFGNRSCD